jgi:outer membrane murein-binding lipoprotein Lpp
MPGITLFASAMSSLKSAYDLSKAMISIHDTKILNAKVIELQGVILAAQSDTMAAQSDQSAALERVRELEKRVADLEAWDAEKQRYELKQVSGFGTFARVLKPEMAAAEPAHSICAACYDSGKKSVLQAMPKLEMGRRMHLCPECKTAIMMAG